jgi:hypothetical protein
MSVTNPYLYSRLTSSSVVSVAVFIASALSYRMVWKTLLRGQGFASVDSLRIHSSDSKWTGRRLVLVRSGPAQPGSEIPSYSHNSDGAKNRCSKITERVAFADNDPKKQILPGHGANDPIDHVQTMSFAYDSVATFNLNQFSRQPTGDSSDNDPSYEIHGFSCTV